MEIFIFVIIPKPATTEMSYTCHLPGQSPTTKRIQKVGELAVFKNSDTAAEILEQVDVAMEIIVKEAEEAKQALVCNQFLGLLFAWYQAGKYDQILVALKSKFFVMKAIDHTTLLKAIANNHNSETSDEKLNALAEFYYKYFKEYLHPEDDASTWWELAFSPPNQALIYALMGTKIPYDKNDAIRSRLAAVCAMGDLNLVKEFIEYTDHIIPMFVKRDFGKWSPFARDNVSDAVLSFLRLVKDAEKRAAEKDDGRGSTKKQKK